MENPVLSSMLTATFGVEVNGREVVVLLPTVSMQGQRWTYKEALQNFSETGEHFGMFDSIEAADRYDDVFHQDLEKGLIPQKRVLQTLTRERP